MRVVGIGNARDLGGIAVSGGRVVVPGLFFRGPALSRADAEGLDELFGRCGVKTVIDVRCGWERDEDPNPQVEGVQYLNIPFWDLDEVGLEYTRPAAGTHPIGRDVLVDPDDYYRELVNPATLRQMAKALNAALDSACDGRPVYVHCAGGKDRTGVLALLILTALGASRDDIRADYLMTNEARNRTREAVFERFLPYCDTPERAWEMVDAHSARPQNLDIFYAALDERCGGVEGLIKGLAGIDQQKRTRIRAVCTRPRP